MSQTRETWIAWKRDAKCDCTDPDPAACTAHCEPSPQQTRECPCHYLTAPAPERKAKLEGPGAETIHACPPDGSGLTPCCGKTPFELPLGDRISSESDAVTCGEPVDCVHLEDHVGECPCPPKCGCCKAEPPAPAPLLRDQIAAAIADATGNNWPAQAFLTEADAVLAVPAIQQLAETRDALRHAEGDRDALDQEQQQLREELAEARAQVERVRKAIAERRTELAEYEAEHEPSGWSDAVSVTCSRIDDALRVFPEPVGIPAALDPQEPS